MCFIACYLIVKLLSGNQFIRGTIGDIIVILLIFFFINALQDFSSLKVAIFALVIAFATELLQYLKLAALLGIENSIITRLILGSVFDPYDLIAYSIGAILAYIIDARIVKKVI